MAILYEYNGTRYSMSSNGSPPAGATILEDTGGTNAQGQFVPGKYSTSSSGSSTSQSTSPVATSGMTPGEKLAALGYSPQAIAEQGYTPPTNPAAYKDQDSRSLAQNPQFNASNTTQSGIDTTGLPPELAAVANHLDSYLAELEKRGQVLNPDIKIGPEQLAEFTRQAENEINPYYSSQLKLARESLLRDVGYSTDEIQRQEQLAERQYKQNLQTNDSNFADQGFAQSGLRNKAEEDLAFNTQAGLDAKRRALDFNVGNSVGKFAQEYGASQIPELNIGNNPIVASGESNFSRSSGNRSLYTLNPDVYSNLVGSSEFERRGAVSSRSSQLESAFRNNQAIDQQRKLLL